MEARVANLCECLVHQGVAAMIGVEDLKGIISKVTWFCIVRSRARVSMEVDLIDHPYKSLCPSGCWVWSLQVILDPLAGFDAPIFFIWDLYCYTVKWVVLYPSIVLHEDVFLYASDVPEMSSKLRATWRLGAANGFDVDDFDDCCFLFLYFFLGGRYCASKDLQLPLC
jgi:hypothetical protein